LYFQSLPAAVLTNYTVNISIPNGENGTPQIVYSLPSSPNEAYRMTFNHVFQGVWASNGTKEISIISDLKIPTGWTVSPYSWTNGSNIGAPIAHIPLSCVPPNGSNMSGLIDGMRFTTQVPMMDPHTWPLSYPVFKFNIEVDNYRWANLAENSLLVFSFTLDKLALDNTTMGGWKSVPFDTPMKMHSRRTVNFDKAYFSINTSATVENKDVEVQVLMASEAFPNYSNSTDSSDVLLVYNNFAGNLVHDPEIGFGDGPGYRTFLIVSIVLIVTVFLAVVIFFVGSLLVFLTRRRTRKE
jgi:hypothetical protein